MHKVFHGCSIFIIIKSNWRIFILIVLGSNFPYVSSVEFNRGYRNVSSSSNYKLAQIFSLRHAWSYNLKCEGLSGFPRKWSRAKFFQKKSFNWFLLQCSSMNCNTEKFQFCLTQNHFIAPKYFILENFYVALSFIIFMFSGGSIRTCIW